MNSAVCTLVKASCKGLHCQAPCMYETRQLYFGPS